MSLSEGHVIKEMMRVNNSRMMTVWTPERMTWLRTGKHRSAIQGAQTCGAAQLPCGSGMGGTEDADLAGAQVQCLRRRLAGGLQANDHRVPLRQRRPGLLHHRGHLRKRQK